MFHRTREAKAKELGTPAFLTEFGATFNSTYEINDIQDLVGRAESTFTSWAYWQFKYYQDITTASQPATKESLYDNYGNL